MRFGFVSDEVDEEEAGESHDVCLFNSIEFEHSARNCISPFLFEVASLVDVFGCSSVLCFVLLKLDEDECEEEVDVELGEPGGVILRTITF